MTVGDNDNAVLVGGPEDQTTIEAGDDVGMFEVHIEGIVHRYIRTGAHRDLGGRNLVVYNYDGEVREGNIDPSRQD